LGEREADWPPVAETVSECHACLARIQKMRYPAAGEVFIDWSQSS
jgi:hypothetical protein